MIIVTQIVEVSRPRCVQG